MSVWRFLYPMFLKAARTDPAGPRGRRKILCEERGITLVETVLTLAIIGLLIAGAFGFFIFGNITFRRGTGHVYLQHSLRHASDYITHEVRYATELEVLTTGDPFPTGPGEVGAGDNYIYYGGEGDPRIYHLNAARLYHITDAIITGVELFTDEKRFYFKIKAEDGGEKYAIDTMVLMLNAHPILKSEVEYIPAIRYRSPD